MGLEPTQSEFATHRTTSYAIRSSRSDGIRTRDTKSMFVFKTNAISHLCHTPRTVKNELSPLGCLVFLRRDAQKLDNYCQTYTL